MGDFAAGFAKGFLNTLNTDARARIASADEYFEKQVETARTTGLANKRKTQGLVDGSVATAKQLQQMGVPKDLIMAIASQNPAELGTFYEQVADANAKGVPLTPEFFADFVQVSKDYKAPNEDFQTFFGRVYQPVAANYSADPEGFDRDRKGNLVATFLGFNAMDRARSKLGTTQVADGMTAEQLLQYGDGAMPNTEGGATVTYDYNQIRERVPGNDPTAKPLDVESIRRLNADLEEEMTKIRVADGGQEMPPEEIKQRAAIVLMERYAADPRAVAELERISGVTTPDPEVITKEVLPPSEEDLRLAGIGEEVIPEEVVPEAAPPDVPAEATGEAPEAQVNPTATPVAPEGDSAPIDIEKEPMLDSIMPGYRFGGDNYDGTSTWISDDGTRVLLKNSDVREYARQQADQ